MSKVSFSQMTMEGNTAKQTQEKKNLVGRYFLQHSQYSSNLDFPDFYFIVWISGTMLDDFYPSGFSDYCLHIHNVSADLFSSFLQIFLDELGILHGTTNYDIYLILWGVDCSDSVNHSRVLVLFIPVLLLTCSQDWTSNSLFRSFGNHTYMSCWTVHWIFETYKLNVLTSICLLLLSMIFIWALIPIFFLKNTGGHVGRNVEIITIKTKKIVQKPWMMKYCHLFQPPQYLRSSSM